MLCYEVIFGWAVKHFDAVEPLLDAGRAAAAQQRQQQPGGYPIGACQTSAQGQQMGHRVDEEDLASLRDQLRRAMLRERFGL